MFRFLAVLFLGTFLAGSAFGENCTHSVDFSDADFQKSVQGCPYARIEGETLIFEIPKEKGSVTAMIQVPMTQKMAQFAGYSVIGEADLCFLEVPQPDQTYFGVKFQFHLPGAKGNPWPSFLHLPQGKAWGTQDWCHSKGGVSWSDEVTAASLELGIQGANGRFAIRNIRFTRGRKCPASTLKLAKIPQTEYSEACLKLPRMRGVMSPGTRPSQDPKEEDFAAIEKWGANLIRWQMGLDGSKDLEGIRQSLEGRFSQLEKVLEMAQRHHLYVVIDVHTMKSSRPIILGTPEGRDLLVDFWVRIAKRFGKHPNVFGFNLMNEPVSADIEEDGPTLNEQYFRLIQAIREVEPETPIILDCDGAGVAEMLEFMQVFPFKNIIYSPHYYKPFELTHQLNLNQESYRPYPNPERGWDREFLRKEMATIREFQQKTGARIYVGEFSCIRWAPGADRFIADCIDLFEESGWDWSYHAFREWQGWNVECDGTPNHPEWKETERKKVLLKGFEKNRQ